jgi:hypothetical protein
MRWFRHHLRQGCWLALTALAINLALSFGHVHAPGSKHSDGALLAAIATSPANSHTSGHDQDNHPDDLCPICMATAVIGNGIAPSAPVLPVQFAEAITDHFVAPVAAPASTQRAAFQSRGPPVS